MRRQRATRLSPEKRREHLLACAIRIFASQGLVAANHAMVAAEAKVSVPTIFVYFPTREALVDAVLSEVERFYTTNMASASDSQSSAVETLMLLSRQLTRTLQTHPDYARIMMEWSVSVRSDIWPRYLKTYRKMNRILAKVIERGQKEGHFRADLDPSDEAALLYAVSTALIQMMETGASQERLDRFQHAAIQSVIIPAPSADKISRLGSTTARKRTIK